MITWIKSIYCISVSGSQKDGVTTITYRRPLAATEASRDREVLTARSQSVVAAFGPLNSRYEANAHSFMDKTTNDVQLDFGASVSLFCFKVFVEDRISLGTFSVS